MKLLTDNLILRTVTIDDLNEVSRMWSRDFTRELWRLAFILVKNIKGKA
jgi:hypothetical protein